jgi:hypothetical protein
VRSAYEGLGWRLATTALNDEIMRVTGAPEGNRNHTLNTAAFKLDRREWGAGSGSGPKRPAGCGARGRTRRGRDAATIRSGPDSGEKHPRGPERSARSDDHKQDFPVPDHGLLDDLTLPAPPLLVFQPAWEQWIADAARAASAPPDHVAMALLSVAGSLVGNACWVHPWPGWREPPAIWAMLVGGPSCGKSRALRKVTEALNELERHVRAKAGGAHAA